MILAIHTFAAVLTVAFIALVRRSRVGRMIGLGLLMLFSLALAGPASACGPLAAVQVVAPTVSTFAVSPFVATPFVSSYSATAVAVPAFSSFAVASPFVATPFVAVSPTFVRSRVIVGGGVSVRVGAFGGVRVRVR